MGRSGRAADGGSGPWHHPAIRPADKGIGIGQRGLRPAGQAIRRSPWAVHHRGPGRPPGPGRCSLGGQAAFPGRTRAAHDRGLPPSRPERLWRARMGGRRTPPRMAGSRGLPSAALAVPGQGQQGRQSRPRPCLQRLSSSPAGSGAPGPGALDGRRRTAGGDRAAGGAGSAARTLGVGHLPGQGA